MKSALLVVDVQNALCAGQWAVHDADAMVDRINRLARRVRAAGLPVVFIQHEENHELMRHQSPGWQLYDKLEVMPEDPRMRKTTCDAFLRTNLLDLLQARGIDRLIVCGFQSDFCVDSTVRGALARGYPVTLVADGHSTLDNGVLTAPQIIAHHNATLANLGSFGPIVTCLPAAEVTGTNQDPIPE